LPRLLEGANAEPQLANAGEGPPRVLRKAGLGGRQTFTEEGESAKTTDRTQLRRLLEFCRLNEERIQFVVVYNVSRFAREKFDHFTLRTLLYKYRITLRSVTEPIDESPTGKFMEGVLAAAAQCDNDVRADRTGEGMRAALELGRRTHQSPLGCLPGRRSGPSLTIDPDRGPWCAWRLRHAQLERPRTMCSAELRPWDYVVARGGLSPHSRSR